MPNDDRRLTKPGGGVKRKKVGWGGASAFKANPGRWGMPTVVKRAWLQIPFNFLLTNVVSIIWKLSVGH